MPCFARCVKNLGPKGRFAIRRARKLRIHRTKNPGARFFGESSSLRENIPLRSKNMFEPNPLKSRFLVCGLALVRIQNLEASARAYYCYVKGVKFPRTRAVPEFLDPGILTVGIPAEAQDAAIPLNRTRRDFQGPPIQGPPHYKLICPYLALFSKMFIKISQIKDM